MYGEVARLYGAGVTIYGPYTRADDRKVVLLVWHTDTGSIAKRTTVSYPKLLMEIKLGRRLGPDETVDHIDDDKTNDAYSNLQILSRADNARKSADPTPILAYGRSKVGRAAASMRLLGDGNPQRKLSDDAVRQIRHDSHYGIYKISELMAIHGVDRRTIYNCVKGISYRHIADDFFDG